VPKNKSKKKKSDRKVRRVVRVDNMEIPLEKFLNGRIVVYDGGRIMELTLRELDKLFEKYL